MEFEIVKRFNDNFHSCLCKLSNDKSGNPYYIHIDDKEYFFPEQFLKIIYDVTCKTNIICSIEGLECFPETGYDDFGFFMLKIHTDIREEVEKFAELIFGKLSVFDR